MALAMQPRPGAVAAYHRDKASLAPKLRGASVRAALCVKTAREKIYCSEECGGHALALLPRQGCTGFLLSHGCAAQHGQIIFYLRADQQLIYFGFIKAPGIPYSESGNNAFLGMLVNGQH